MTWFEQGRIQGGAIVLPKPLPLPEGTEVAVRIETKTESVPSVPVSDNDFTSLPFFGMWADREDMTDSTEWVRQEREQWQQRQNRQD